MEVLRAPDPRLKITTKPVKKISATLANLTREMIKLTLNFKDPEGVGLASTQIGQEERFFVGKIGGGFKTFINPEITWFSKTTRVYFEGCLSVPDIYGHVKRSLSIKVKYQDLKGRVQQGILKGVDAWIFQHELDHLNGVLFSERVLEQRGKFYKFTGRDKTGQDIFEGITL